MRIQEGVLEKCSNSDFFIPAYCEYSIVTGNGLTDWVDTCSITIVFFAGVAPLFLFEIETSASLCLNPLFSIVTDRITASLNTIVWLRELGHTSRDN